MLISVDLCSPNLPSLLGLELRVELALATARCHDSLNPSPNRWLVRANVDESMPGVYIPATSVPIP